jgi:aromatic-amino-acid transaminase
MTMIAASPFSHIDQAPPDPILGLTEAFNADSNPNKVNLGVGVYQDASGKVPILDVVREAERRLLETESTKTYLPIDGLAVYDRAVQELLLGEGSPLIAEGRVITAQALGGTGGLKIGADLLKRFFPNATVYISTPSWENHRALFEAAGFAVDTYRYYDAQSHGLDFDGMMEDLRDLPSQSIAVLHACCHNPSGVDLNEDQWRQVVDLLADADHVPFLDFAYQGFGAGIDEDAFAVRAFAKAGIPCLVSNSFSKSFSLYRERVGALTVLTREAEESKRVLSQLKRVIRTNYSSPAAHGSQVIAAVLADSELQARWVEELTEMRDRIRSMRTLFVSKLREAGVRQDFGFIEEQRGMFSFAGLPLEVVRRLRSENSIYILDSSRMCVAALSERNIDYVCSSIATALSGP